LLELGDVTATVELDQRPVAAAASKPAGQVGAGGGKAKDDFGDL